MDRIKILAVFFLLLFLAVVVISRAWVCDDAYITFRVVDNFVNGEGLTWNTAERVQVSTHPLWLLLMSGVYLVTREVFYSSMFVSTFISLAAAAMLVFGVARTRLSALLALSILALSNAFVDYATSGLENALTYFILTLFMFFYFGNGGRRVLLLTLIAALGGLNRLDTLLLYAPALLYVLVRRWRCDGARATVGATLVGLLPLFLWEGFSLFYYGFLFPNTAFAKLGAGVPVAELLVQGGYYVLNSLKVDPITLAAIAGAGGAALALRKRGHAPLAVGLVLYLLYVVRIGGDFASGRFLAAPMLVAVGLIARYDWEAFDWRRTLAVFLIAVALGAVAAHPTFRLDAGDLDDIRRDVFIDEHGIADERMWYYLTNSLVQVMRGAPDHLWKSDGLRLRQAGAAVVVDEAIGMVGFYAGPKVHIVDQWALADPLLARLPAWRNARWRIGHFDRVIPDGYLETLRTGENVIADERLAACYDRLSLITRGRLFDRERLIEIWRFNLGRYDHLIDFDAYRYPNMVYVGLDSVSEFKAAGTSPYQPGNVAFYDSGVEVDLGAPVYAAQIELSLDSNDRYQVVYLRDGVRLAAQAVPAAGSPPGLAVYRMDAPRRAWKRGYDAIRVFPVRGDDEYALGHLLLVNAFDRRRK